MRPEIRHFYHQQSSTISYVVGDAATSSAAVIDPALGFSAVSGRVDSAFAEEIISYVEKHGLNLEWILETHAHADHISAQASLNELRGGNMIGVGGKVAIGEGIKKVQAHFANVFNLKEPFVADGHQFDHLFSDDEAFNIGDLQCRVMHTPGHTNDSVTYLVGNSAFVGDTLFMTDSGTGRCDFPGGDAGLLFDSIHKLFALPPDTVIYLCHDYPPAKRTLRFETSLAEQIANNIHVGGAKDRSKFIAMRESRDATLSLPDLILPSIQVNIQAGHLPQAEDNGIAYIRTPLDTL